LAGAKAKGKAGALSEAWKWQCNLSRVVSCPSAAVACTRVLILWDYIKMSSGRLVKNLNWWAWVGVGGACSSSIFILAPQLFANNTAACISIRAMANWD